MTAPLTEAQTAIIQWLFDNGSECVLDRFGGFIAQGERRTASFSGTFIRLVASGHVEGAGPNRLRLTVRGKSVATARGNPTDPVTQRDYTDPRVREAYIGDEDTVTDFAEPSA